MRNFTTSRSVVSVRALCQQAKHDANLAKLKPSTDHLESDIACFHRHLNSLKNRTGQFAVMTPARRDAELCKAGFGKPFILADVCELSDEDLIEMAAGLAAEIERRSMQLELSPAARRAVEESIIDNDHIDQRFDSQFYQNAY